MKNLFIDTTELDMARIAKQKPFLGLVHTGMVRPGRKFECVYSDASAVLFSEIGADAFYTQRAADVQCAGLTLLYHFLDGMSKEEAQKRACDVLAQGNADAVFADFEKRPVSSWPEYWPRP